MIGWLEFYCSSIDAFVYFLSNWHLSCLIKRDYDNTEAFNFKAII